MAAAEYEVMEILSNSIFFLIIIKTVVLNINLGTVSTTVIFYAQVSHSIKIIYFFSSEESKIIE